MLENEALGPNLETGLRKAVRGRDFQLSPKKEGMKFRGGYSKLQTDNLEPLIRFLETNTGKYWDRLYSQLCQKMNKKTLLGQHLFDHLFDFVETNVYFDDSGRLIAAGKWGPEVLQEGWWWPQFYVHPKTGVLLKYKKKKRKKK